MRADRAPQPTRLPAFPSNRARQGRRGVMPRALRLTDAGIVSESASDWEPWMGEPPASFERPSSRLGHRRLRTRPPRCAGAARARTGVADTPARRPARGSGDRCVSTAWWSRGDGQRSGIEGRPESQEGRESREGGGGPGGPGKPGRHAGHARTVQVPRSALSPSAPGASSTRRAAETAESARRWSRVRRGISSSSLRRESTCTSARSSCVGTPCSRDCQDTVSNGVRTASHEARSGVAAVFGHRRAAACRFPYGAFIYARIHQRPTRKFRDVVRRVRLDTVVSTIRSV